MGNLGIIGISAAFANVAGRGGRKLPEMSFVGLSDDPFIQSLSCYGKITIESIKDGKQVARSYYSLESQKVEIQADADTIISIKGYVTELQFTKYNNDPDIDDWEGYMDISSVSVGNNNNLKTLSVALNENIEELDLAANTQLQTLYCNSCQGLTSLDLAANTQLQYLNCNSCKGLTSLDLAANTQLQYLDCGNIPNLTSLDLAANTQLQTLYCNSCQGLTSISYPATNENVSTKVARAITDADAADGTVYTDNAATYYDTIATAATAKGWTIAQISE